MRVRIIAVGKIKEKATQELLRDYYGRIDRYARFDEVELKDGTEEEVTERFEKAIPERSRVVALEVLGQRWSSDQLAQHLGLPLRQADGSALPQVLAMVSALSDGSQTVAQPPHSVSP